MSIRILIPALSLAMFSLSATAASPSHASKRDCQRAPQQIVLADANEKILAEAMALDANGDGRIDAAEFAAAHEKRRAKRMAERHAKHDVDGDGSISVEEFVAKRQNRLAEMDLDGDGIVSDEEFRQARQKHHPRGPRAERGEKPASR